MDKNTYYLAHPEKLFENEEDETYFTQAEVLLGMLPTFYNHRLDRNMLIENICAKTNNYLDFTNEIMKRMLVYNKYNEILIEAKCEKDTELLREEIRCEEQEKANERVQNYCDHHWGYKEWVDSCYYKCTCTKCGKTEYFYERD